MPVVPRPLGQYIHYRVEGTRGPVVVLIQGMVLSSRYWMGVPGTLAGDYRVLLVDNRGTGQSSRPIFPFTIPEMAADVLAVMDHAGVDRATVVGISLGGMVAQQLALLAPQRLTGLALLATTPGVPHGTIPSLHALSTLLTLPLMPAGASTMALNRLFLTPDTLPRAAEYFHGWGNLLREDPIQPLTFTQHLGAAALHSTGFFLPRLRVPTVVMAGDGDALIPRENSRTLARLIPGARLELLAGVGHALYNMDPTAVRRVVDVLNKTTAAP
jgi:3-oxoadipate enol-lactonase